MAKVKIELAGASGEPKTIKVSGFTAEISTSDVPCVIEFDTSGAVTTGDSSSTETSSQTNSDTSTGNHVGVATGGESGDSTTQDDEENTDANNAEIPSEDVSNNSLIYIVRPTSSTGRYSVNVNDYLVQEGSFDEILSGLEGQAVVNTPVGENLIKLQNTQGQNLRIAIQSLSRTKVLQVHNSFTERANVQDKTLNFTLEQQVKPVEILDEEEPVFG